MGFLKKVGKALDRFADTKVGSALTDAGKAAWNLTSSPVRSLVGQNSGFSKAISFEKEDFKNEKVGKVIDKVDNVTGTAALIAGAAVGGAALAPKIGTVLAKVAPKVLTSKDSLTSTKGIGASLVAAVTGGGKGIGGVGADVVKGFLTPKGLGGSELVPEVVPVVVENTVKNAVAAIDAAPAVTVEEKTALLGYANDVDRAVNLIDVPHELDGAGDAIRKALKETPTVTVSDKGVKIDQPGQNDWIKPVGIGVGGLAVGYGLYKLFS